MKNLIKKIEINVDEEADEILDGNEDEFEDLQETFVEELSTDTELSD